MYKFCIEHFFFKTRTFKEFSCILKEIEAESNFPDNPSQKLGDFFTCYHSFPSPCAKWICIIIPNIQVAQHAAKGLQS